MLSQNTYHTVFVRVAHTIRYSAITFNDPTREIDEIEIHIINAIQRYQYLYIKMLIICQVTKINITGVIRLSKLRR